MVVASGSYVLHNCITGNYIQRVHVLHVPFVSIGVVGTCIMAEIHYASTHSSQVLQIGWPMHTYMYMYCTHGTVAYRPLALGSIRACIWPKKIHYHNYLTYMYATVWDTPALPVAKNMRCSSNQQKVFRNTVALPKRL